MLKNPGQESPDLVKFIVLWLYNIAYGMEGATKHQGRPEEIDFITKATWEQRRKFEEQAIIGDKHLGQFLSVAQAEMMHILVPVKFKKEKVATRAWGQYLREAR